MCHRRWLTLTLDKLVPTTVFVLVQDSVTNCNRLGKLLERGFLFFLVLEVRNPRSSCKQIQCVVKKLVVGWKSHIYLVSTHSEKQKGNILLSHLTKPLLQSKGLHIQKPLPPRSISAEAGISTTKLGEAQALVCNSPQSSTGSVFCPRVL